MIFSSKLLVDVGSDMFSQHVKLVKSVKDVLLASCENPQTFGMMPVETIFLGSKITNPLGENSPPSSHGALQFFPFASNTAAWSRRGKGRLAGFGGMRRLFGTSHGLFVGCGCSTILESSSTLEPQFFLDQHLLLPWFLVARGSHSPKALH